jgi:transcriptional regulator with XRE-family HTH domain
MAAGENIGSIIRTRRRARGMTQLELSEAVGIAPESLSRAERGVAQPKVQTLVKIAKVLDVPIETFTGTPAPAAGESHADSPELLRLRRHLERLDRKTVRKVLALVELLPSAAREKKRASR